MAVSENRARLNSNKQQVQIHAMEVLLEEVRPLEVDPVVASWSTENPTPIPFSEFTIDQLSYFADQLEVKRDADRNIPRYKAELSDGTTSVVRDARGATPVSPEVKNFDPNSIRMLMIGATRAGLFILDHVEQTEAINAAKDQLYVLFNEAMKDSSKAHTKDEVKEFIEPYNAKVKDIMVKNGVDKIPGIALDKDLTYAYNATNIHNQNAHISTVSEFEGRTIIESDVMALGVTENQMKVLKWIGDEPAPKVVGEAWFDDASPIRKAMIVDVVRNLLDKDGKVQKVMPTQLRNLMPLVKNAYVKFTSVIDGGKVVDVAENLHCGAVYLELKEDKKGSVKKELTEMAAQVASFAPSEKIAVNQVNSTSPWNLAAKAEAEADKQSREAMQRTGNDSSNTPFNILSKFSRDAGGYERTLNKLSEPLLKYAETLGESNDYNVRVVRESFEAIGLWIKVAEPASLLSGVSNMIWGDDGEKRYKEVIDYLDILENKSVLSKREDHIQLIKVLRNAVEAKHLLTYKMTSKTNHDNVRLFECFSAINAAVHNPDGAFAKFFAGKAGIADMLDRITYMSFNCMSGKDRTGVAMFDASVQGVGDFVAVKVQAFDRMDSEAKKNALDSGRAPTEEERASAAAWKEDGGIAKKQELASVINAHEHTQLIPSQNNIGTHGVKSDSESAQTLEVFKGNMLTRATASFNKLKYAKGVEFDASNIQERKASMNRDIYAPVVQDVAPRRRSGSFAEKEDERRQSQDLGEGVQVGK